MKTKIIPEQKIDLYEFDELAPEIQQKVIENNYDINVDYDWWNFTYEDAANIGLKITGFDLGRGSYCKGSFIIGPMHCAENIIQQHGEECETYKTAAKYLPQLQDEESEDFEDTKEEFINDLLEDYRIILQQEYEYRTSKELIIETLKCNEYLFTFDGKIESL